MNLALKIAIKLTQIYLLHYASGLKIQSIEVCIIFRYLIDRVNKICFVIYNFLSRKISAAMKIANYDTENKILFYK